ncbi:MAG: T9SS type A sorting domain-containing protein, partial [Bacteroidales bacterium]|nr:T9SS type A sorting domain-containing protein [Bacteroidales bacterium]
LIIENGGALLVYGTVSSAGTVTHNETLTGPVNTWHLISAPTSADISESNFKPVSGEDDFYAWHQTNPGTWVNYLNTTVSPTFGEVNITDNFVPGKGYLVAYKSENPAKSFVGTPNSGTISFTLKYDETNTTSAGSNLLGNPYTAYIDWNKADRGLLADNYAYVYNPNKHSAGVGGYDNVNGNLAGALLRPHLGFFVIAKPASNDQTFNFSPAMQEINSGKKDQNAEPQKLILKLSGEQFYEQAILSINSNSTAARDRNDAIFMGSYNPNVPQLYSITSDGVKVAINSLPTVTSRQSIALGMTFPEDGEYIFSASIEGESFEQEIIYLRDTETDTYHKLDKPVVLFAEAGQTDEQYELVFGATGIEEAAFADTKYAVAYNNNYLTILGEDGELSVELIDLNGRTLYKNNHQLAGGTLRILNTSAKGLVLLKLTNGATTEVHKVIVR